MDDSLANGKFLVRKGYNIGRSGEKKTGVLILGLFAGDLLYFPTEITCSLEVSIEDGKLKGRLLNYIPFTNWADMDQDAQGGNARVFFRGPYTVKSTSSSVYMVMLVLYDFDIEMFQDETLYGVQFIESQPGAFTIRPIVEKKTEEFRGLRADEVITRL